MTREDLIADARALVDRAEYRFDWFPDDVVVVGFRSSGALSLFLGEDEVYQFNTAGELRRGYWQGKLLKAERGELVQLARERKDEETTLNRRDIPRTETDQHVQRLAERLERLSASLASGRFELCREVAATDGGATARLRDWLAARRPQPVQVAKRPNL